MPVGDIIETAMVHYNLSQNELNVLHFRLTSIVGTELTAQQKADAISTAWGGTIQPLLSTVVGYRGLKYRVLAPTATAVIISTAGAVTGTRAGDSLPSQVSAVISLRSSLAPPRVRGRLYAPTPVEGDNDANGQPTGAYQTAVGALGTFMTSTHTLVNGGNSVVITPVIWRRPPVSAYYALDQFIVRSSWGTQRRRSRLNRSDVPAI